MADIGFNDNLSVSGRKFHFQTASNTKSGEVQCEIFEEGRLLSKEIIEFERRKLASSLLFSSLLIDLKEVIIISAFSPAWPFSCITFILM